MNRERGGDVYRGMYAPIRFAAFTAVLLVGVTACGSDSSSSGSPASGGASPTATTAATGRSGDYGTPAGTAGGSTAGAAAAVTIKSLAFNVPASVKAGTEFTITNDDDFKHTFSDKGGKFDVSLEGVATEKLTIAEPGTYEIVCHIHSSMHATLVVT